MVGPTAAVAWLGGLDLAGVGALTEIEEVLEAQFVPISLLGPNGKFDHDAPIGKGRYALREKGYVTETAASLRRVIAEDPRGADSVIGYFGADPGARCTIAHGLSVKGFSLVPVRDGLSEIDLTYLLGTETDTEHVVYEEATLLAGGATLVGPQTLSTVDLGAAIDATWIAWMADDIFWGDPTTWAGYEFRDIGNSRGHVALLTGPSRVQISLQSADSAAIQSALTAGTDFIIRKDADNYISATVDSTTLIGSFTFRVETTAAPVTTGTVSSGDDVSVEIPVVGGGMTLEIEHATTATGTYSAYTDIDAFRSAAAHFCAHSTSATTLNRYARFKLSWSGAGMNPSAKILAAVAAA